MDLKIIYEDEDVLALDKPAGVVVSPESTGSMRSGVDNIL